MEILVINEKNTKLQSDKICFQDEFYDTEKLDCDLYFKDYFSALETKTYKLVYSKDASSPQIINEIPDEADNLTIRIDSQTHFSVKSFPIKYIILL